MALTDRKKATKPEQAKTLDNLETGLPDEKELEHGVVDDAVDGVIDLSVTAKKRFRVDRGNGDNAILELNTSDMSIITRLQNLYPKLEELSQDAAVKQLDKQTAGDDDMLARISQALIKIDTEMRQMLDDIFESNVSEVCAPSGSLFDPFNGEFRFEHIIDVISKLYTNNLNEEFKKMSAKMKKHTAKYTKGR